MIAVVGVVIIFGTISLSMNIRVEGARVQCVLLGGFVALASVLAGGIVIRYLKR